MEKAQIMEILNDWNFWTKDHDAGITRQDYLKKLKALENTSQVITITGVRRSGKSTIMLQYIKKLIEKGIDAKNILYINFEDLRFKRIDLELLNNIYEIYLEYVQPDKIPFIFLDEVHKVKDWEKFARTMHELKKAKVFVSGSNTKLLFGKISSVLTGRHLDLLVYPLDFKEFLFFKNLEIKNKLDAVSKKYKIKSLLDEYLEYGGYPLVCLKESKKILLETYFEDIINKDIMENHSIDHITKLKSLARFYLTNTGRRMSFNKLSRYFNLSLDTVERYSYYLEEAKMVYFIKKFSYKVKEQERTMAVVYSIDNGLTNILGFKYSKDVGWLFQNAVANELIRRYGKENIFYWMNETQEEVDFVVKKGLQVKKLIQVSYNLSNLETKEREIKALIKASKELRCNNLIIINDDFEGEEIINKKKIKFIPLWKWLLEDSHK